MDGTGEAEAISVKFEGFSIREYVSKTRSENVMKCWPFGGGTSEQTVRNFLPPISVEKFRWWSHEFDLLKSEEVRPLICGESSKSVPSKLVKNSGGESTVVMRSVRAKRKKRSILEIFAEEDADVENDAQNLKLVALREVGLGVKRKMTKERKNKKKPKLKDESEAKSDKQNVALKLKKIIGSERVESAVRKEKSLKVKLHSSVAITKKPINKSRFNKGLLKGTSHHIVSTNNKCQMKSLTEQQEKNKNPRISKSNGKNKKPVVVPVRGILKKYKEDDILVKRSTLDNNNNNPEDDCQRSLISLAPKSGRHVRFSENDDVVVSSPLKQLEETEVSATNKRSDKMPEVQFTYDREFVRPQIGFRGDHFPETSTLLNEVALPNTEGRGMFAKSFDSTYGLDPRNLPRYDSNTSAMKNPMLPNQYFGTCSSSSSSSYMPVSDDGRTAAFPYGRYHHLTPKELMWSICSVPPKRNQREFTNGLFGLPLNSQGELIQFSTGEASFNQLMMPAASTPLKASTSYSSSRTSNSNSSLDMMKNEEIRRKLNHLSFLETGLHPNQLTPSFIGLSTSSSSSSSRENDINPATTISSTPTIRLMGKEFSVKGSSLNLEDEKVWTDKEIIAEHRPPPPPPPPPATANYGLSNDNSVKHNHVGFMMSSKSTPSESVPFQLQSYRSTFPHTGTENTNFSMNQCQQRPPFPLEFPFVNQDDNSEELLLQPPWFQTSVKKHNNYHHPYSFSRANVNPDSQRHSMQPTIGTVSYPQQQQQQQQQLNPFQGYSQLAPFSGGTSPGGISNRFSNDHVRRNRTATVEEKKWRKRSIASSGKHCKIPNNNNSSVDQEGNNNNNNNKNKMMGSNGNEEICRPMSMYSAIISSSSSVAAADQVSGSEKSASAANNNNNNLVYRR